MTTENPETLPPANDPMQVTGPYAIPGRNWLLIVFLWGLLLIKYGVIFGAGMPWWGYVGGSIGFWLIPIGIGWLAWKQTGERPYWGDNGFIGAGAMLFILLSVPAYTVGLGGG